MNRMKLTAYAAAAAAVAFGAGCSPAVQRPFAASERHVPKLVMGREYWTYLSSWYYNDQGFSDYPDGPVEWWAKSVWANASLTNLPVFRDCGIVRNTIKPPPDAAGMKATWRTVQENCTPTRWKCLQRAAKKDRPLVLTLSSKRNVLALAGEVDLDCDDWAAFKAANPNLVCTRTICEWGNDILLCMRRTPQVKNPKRRAELEKRWRQYAMTNRYDRLELARWYVDRQLKVHYDDNDMFMAFRSCMSLDHVAAAWGAKLLTLETTNTTGGDSEYRWDVAGMFTRGAARQFGLPWGWYVAVYFNGPGKDGTWRNNSVCSEMSGKRDGYNIMPEGGTSASAQRRCFYYAYLNGANAVEPEGWYYHFITTNTPTGKAELSVRGRNFSDFHDFTSAHPERGIAYAPVAILTPFAQGYTAYGGRAWGSCPYTLGDYAVDALFFTIAPGWERMKGLKAGIQDGNLHNSRFAMMYDVLVPDSPQPKAEFAKALFAYPAAILVGDYPDASMFEDVLAAYEKAGGRLIRLTADSLPPLNDRTVGEILAGRLKFPTVERTLDGLQRDLFPFAVEGDCQYGANKTEKGWWLWAFNNKGVRKFADTFENIDHSCDSEITVRFTHASPAPVKELMTDKDVPVAGGRFKFTVPAGSFAVFEIGSDDTAVHRQTVSTFTNPVIAADWPDPVVYNGGDGWYYSVATWLATIRKSRNLVDWEDAEIDPLTPKARARLHQVSHNLWAPCVVKLNGKWVLYISLYVSDSDCRIAALTSNSPTGPFEFANEVVDSRREGVENAIDPYVLAVGGKVWMFFGSLADGIHRIELADDGLSVKPGAKPAHVAGVRHPVDKMKRAWEGSYLHWRNGWWYLFVSGGHFRNHTYYLTVGRSKTIDGEFVDRMGRPMKEGLAEPILSSGKDDFFYGPGHNGEIFKSADGRDYIFFHSHVAGYKPEDRPTLLQELLWDVDGWPYFKDGRPQKVERRFK